MKVGHLSAIMLIASAAGCSPTPDAFGKSYGECVLKQLKDQSEEGRQIILDICRQNFERPSKVKLEASAEKIQEDILGRKFTSFRFDVTNTSSTVSITKVRVRVGFYQNAESIRDGVGRGSPINVWTWDLDTMIEPNGRVFLTGALKEQDQLPSQFFVVTESVAIKEMPVR